MQIRDVMTPNVEVIHPDASLQEAAGKMKQLNVGSLPVCDGMRIQGMITDRDIVTRAVAEGRHPAQTRASEVMTPRIMYCYDDQDVREAARVMEENQIRRLPIVNRNKELVGIVSLGDLAVDTGNERMAGETLTEVSQPSRPGR